MAHAVNFKKVKVNHNGGCDGFTYVAGQPTDLPETVLKALGEDAYEDLGESTPEEPKLSYKELQEKAKALGLPTNEKREELERLIAEKEAADAGNAE